MTQLSVEELQCSPVGQQPLEIVERKGLGHPDSICDAVMEHASVALTRAYRERFGRVLHYNLDKGLLAAGSVEHRFGGGHMQQPMRLIVGDRATFDAEGQHVPVQAIVEDATRKWFQQHLPRIDQEQHVRFQSELRPSSAELTGIFEQANTAPVANDTSALVGYAPLTETERVVLETERFLNSRDFKQIFPDTGEDVKVMGVRRYNALSLTVAMPFLEESINAEAMYFRRKAEVIACLREHLAAELAYELDTTVVLNTLDRPGQGINGVYLSLLGTSAEDADSGQVGRGNRANGLISLQRPAPAEAAAGKNAVSHVGKIYNVLAHRIANRIYTDVAGVREVYVWLCSQIGASLDQPQVATAQIAPESGVGLASLQRRVADVLEDELARITTFIGDLADGRYRVS